MRFAFLFFCLISGKIFSQNLLKNGDFEIRGNWFNYTLVNKLLFNPYSSLDKVKYWDNPNRCSPDIHKNGKHQAILRVGQSKSFSGEYYLGINHHKNGFRDEYAETKLKRGLIKDSLYCITIYVMSDSKNQYYLSNLYIAFSNKYYHQRERAFFFLQDTVGFRKADGSIIENTEEYIELSNIYKAKGGESHFLVGNFNVRNRYHYLDYPANYNKTIFLGFIYSYYYFDNISLVPVKDSSACPCYHYNKTETYKEAENIIVGDIKNKKYVLTNVKFSLKTSKLIKTGVGNEELNLISEVLQKDSLVNITIVSHVFETDMMHQNKKISLERADVIKNYFVNLKINENRIKTKGAGSSMPLYDNDTKEHQEKNTRIELQFD